MSTNLPALYTGEPQPRRQRAAPSQPFNAHVLGQDGQRRGLRGGAPVLDAARAAYLDAEWRGADDRRLAAGTFRRVSL
jgi:hypothetical protein